jgi:antitoxin ParD1/3/4
MPTRNVVLTDYQSRLIDELVTSGRYQNASEVLREGVRLVERQAAENEARLERLRGAAQVGIDDIQRGDFDQFDSFDALEREMLAEKDAIIGKARTGV